MRCEWADVDVDVDADVETSIRSPVAGGGCAVEGREDRGGG